MALGTYNFSGDLGKVIVPAVVALATTWVGWREATRGYAVVGLVAAGVLLLVLARLRVGGAGAVGPGAADTARPSGWGIRDARGFTALSALPVIGHSTPPAFLPLPPFLLLP